MPPFRYCFTARESTAKTSADGCSSTELDVGEASQNFGNCEALVDNEIARFDRHQLDAESYLFWSLASS
jgi:hypothetical protein